VETKVGARILPVSFTGRKKVMVTKQEKERDDNNNKKDQKPPVDPMSKKNRKKSRWGRRAPRPHGLPKRALGLSFGPQVPPDSGFTPIL
jgi:hypothetical protein